MIYQVITDFDTKNSVRDAKSNLIAPFLDFERFLLKKSCIKKIKFYLYFTLFKKKK